MRAKSSGSCPGIHNLQQVVRIILFFPGHGSLIVTGKSGTNTKIQGSSKLLTNTPVVLMPFKGGGLGSRYLSPLTHQGIDLLQDIQAFRP